MSASHDVTIEHLISPRFVYRMIPTPRVYSPCQYGTRTRTGCRRWIHSIMIGSRSNSVRRCSVDHVIDITFSPGLLAHMTVTLNQLSRSIDQSINNRACMGIVRHEREHPGCMARMDPRWDHQIQRRYRSMSKSSVPSPRTSSSRWEPVQLPFPGR